MSDEFSVNKVTAEVITDFAKSITTNIWESIKKHVKDAKNKDEIDCGHAFEEYLRNSYNKFSKIKTLLYRQEPKDLYTFFECVGVVLNNKSISTESVKSITDVGNKVIITGTGGIGKSTMMKHFFLNCVIEKSFIPILIELRSINDRELKDISIIDILYENIYSCRFPLEKDYFIYSLESGCYLVLFDGYDEVKQEKTEKLTKEILNLCDKYPGNHYILSSRPTSEFIGWSDFVELRSSNLSKAQALSLINKLDYDKDIKQHFYQELEGVLYDKYETFASNPLLLTIMLLTFENRASIPDKLNDFYEQAFAALFNVHDATKGAYRRDIKSGLGYEDFKLVFAYICFKSYFNYSYEFTENALIGYIEQAKVKLNKEFNSEYYKDDLVKSVCMLIREGLHYKFSHRSFQEYFAAWYTCKLTDDVQKKLVAGWLKESNRLYTDNYIHMLFDLQTEKCKKIILLPGLKKIKKIYDSNGKSTPYIFLHLFKGISVIGLDENKKVSLTVKDSYLCEIYSLSLVYGNFQRSSVNRDENEVVDLLNSRFPDMKNVTCEELEQDGILEEVVEKLYWFKEQLDFILGLFGRYSINSIKNKRNILSIVDEL